MPFNLGWKFEYWIWLRQSAMMCVIVLGPVAWTCKGTIAALLQPGWVQGRLVAIEKSLENGNVLRKAKPVKSSFAKFEHNWNVRTNPEYPSSGDFHTNMTLARFHSPEKDGRRGAKFRRTHHFSKTSSKASKKKRPQLWTPNKWKTSRSQLHTSSTSCLFQQYIYILIPGHD